MPDVPSPPDKPQKPVRPRGLGRKRKNPGALRAYEAAEKARIDRRAQVFSMRCQGLYFRDIAEKLNLSLAQCHEDFEKGRQQYSFESVEQERALFNARMDLNHARLNADIARLQEIIQKHRELGEGGHIGSARIVVEAVNCRAGIMAEQRQIAIARLKMNGGDAPSKVEIAGKDGGPIQYGPVIMIPPERDDGSSIDGVAEPVLDASGKLDS